MPFQFPISSPYLFEKDKGVGFGSLYYGCTQKLLEYFPLMQSLYAQSLTQTKNVFACSKHLNLENA
jgi:hypothetical protein